MDVLFLTILGGKSIGSLPVGALPFIVGSFFPVLAVTIPSMLYIRSVSKKRAKDKSSC